MSDLGLSIRANDPTQRLIQRLVELETRAAALERHRDVRMTPFSVPLRTVPYGPNDTFTTVFDNVNLSIPSGGGRAWVLLAGQIQMDSSFAAVGDVYDNNFLVSVDGHASATQVNPRRQTSVGIDGLPMSVTDLPASPGRTSIPITMTAYTNAQNVASTWGYYPGPAMLWSASGFVMEWPQ